MYRLQHDLNEVSEDPVGHYLQGEKQVGHLEPLTHHLMSTFDFESKMSPLGDLF